MVPILDDWLGKHHTIREGINWLVRSDVAPG